jgi:hypothetical protein
MALLGAEKFTSRRRNKAIPQVNNLLVGTKSAATTCASPGNLFPRRGMADLAGAHPRQLPAS